MLRRIAMRHHVTYLALSPHRGDSSWTERANEYCHSLLVIPWREAPKYTSVFYHDLARNLILSSLPYAIEKYHSPALENFIRSRRPPEYDLLVCDFLAPSVNICRKPGLPSLLFQHNIESIIWERHYRTERNIWKRSYFRMQWKRMLRYEKAKCRCFDGILTVSSSDSDYLREEFGLDNVIGHVPTGVDIDYFRPMQGVRSRENHLVFTGSMDWLPNEDAVIYFVREIYPMIRAAVPDVTFTVAGRNPSS
ncbi:MAG: glycosyltransferase, partial [Syntrophales bacterium]